MTKRKKRAWWKQKSERIAQRRFGGFRISFASPHSSFVLEPDYADITKRPQLMSHLLLKVHNRCAIATSIRRRIIKVLNGRVR